MKNAFEESNKENELLRNRSRKKNNAHQNIINETKKIVKGTVEDSVQVEEIVEQSEVSELISQNIIKDSTEEENKEVEIEKKDNASVLGVPQSQKGLIFPLKVQGLDDGKWVESVNRVLSLKKPGGAFSKSLQRENFNLNSSPYLIAFFKYISDKINHGVAESQKIGYSTIAYQTIVKALISSGELDALADDDILLYLLDALKNDVQK